MYSVFSTLMLLAYQALAQEPSYCTLSETTDSIVNPQNIEIQGVGKWLSDVDISIDHTQLINESQLAEYLNLLIADSIGLFDLNGWLIRQDTDARIIKLENLSPDFIFNPVAPGSDVVSSDSTAPVKGLAYETILEMIDTCQTVLLTLPSPGQIQALKEQGVDVEASEYSDHNPIPQSLAEQVLETDGNPTKNVISGQKEGAQKGNYWWNMGLVYRKDKFNVIPFTELERTQASFRFVSKNSQNQLNLPSGKKYMQCAGGANYDAEVLINPTNPSLPPIEFSYACVCREGFEYNPFTQSCEKEEKCPADNLIREKEERETRCSSICDTCGEFCNQCERCALFAFPVDEENQPGLCSCIDGFRRDPEHGCVPDTPQDFGCRSGEYKDGEECERCHPTCLECSGPNDDDCTACHDTRVDSAGRCDCKENYEPDEKDERKCYCPKGFYLDVDICVECGTNCEDCDVTGCKKCADYAINQGIDCQCMDGQPGPCQKPSGYCNPMCAQGACCEDDEDYCYSCKAPSAFYWNGKCICPVGSVFRDGECQVCDDILCVDCNENGDVCDKCAKNAHYSEDEDRCVCNDYAKFDDDKNECIPFNKQCDYPNQFVNQTEKGKKCEFCHPSCAMCTGPGEDECLLCIEGAELKKDDCEDKSGRCVCDENEFVSKEGCQKCHPLCQGCHGKGAQSCDRCALGAVWNDKGFCSCPAGQKFFDGACADATCLAFFEGDETADCTNCDDPNCATCDPSNSAVCTGCELPYVVDPSNDTCSCPKGSFDDGGDCVRCHETCEECVGEMPNQCQVCGPLRVIQPGTSAPSSCVCKPDTFYSDVSDSCVKLESRCDKGEYLAEDGKCYDCDESCAECVGESWLECTKCKEGSHIELIKHLYWGMCACNGQQFLNKYGKCQDCHPSCKDCLGEGPNSCTSCFEDVYELVRDEKGQRCECKDPTFLKSEDGQCIPTFDERCESYQFFDELEGCKDCPDSCVSCQQVGSPSAAGTNPVKCTSCQRFLELNDLGECVPLREEGFYFDGEERLRCPEKCAKCNEDGKCDECNEGAFKDEKDDECKCKFGFVEAANGECMKKGTSEICLPNFVFIDGECKRCDDSCQTCDGTGPLDCKICADNFIRNKIGACECEEGFFLDIHCKCKRCAPGCLDCIGERPEDCRECAKGTVGPNCECLEGWYFEEDYNECIPEHLEVDCEYWQFLDAAEDKCKECHWSCASCQGPLETDCNTCGRGAELSITSPSGDMELPFGKCECKDTIIQMNERGECVECNPLCADCLDKDHCLMCEENISRYDEEKKMCVCIDGLYFNESRQTCVISPDVSVQHEDCLAGTFRQGANDCTGICDAACLACDGTTNPDTCIACYPPNVVDGGKCECQLGHQLPSPSEKCEPKCPLSPGCLICTNPTDVNSCMECLHPDLQTGTAGTDLECPCPSDRPIFFWDEFTCIKQADCQDYPGYFDGPNCRACHKSCETCNGSLDDECTSCPKGYALVDGRCLCGNGYTTQTGKQECLKCKDGCEVCEKDQPENCKKCFKTFMEEFREKDNQVDCKCPPNTRQDENECVVDNDDSPCDVGEFLDENDDCQPCNFPCKACEGTADNCTVCADNTDAFYEEYDSKDLGTVKPEKIYPYCECKVGFRKDGNQCSTCGTNCEACTTATDCDICLMHYISVPSNPDCQCPNGSNPLGAEQYCILISAESAMNLDQGFGYQTDNAIKCNNPYADLVCDNSGAAKSCNIDLGYEIEPVGDVCRCPTGYFEDPANLKAGCQQCKHGCSECTANGCTVCTVRRTNDGDNSKPCRCKDEFFDFEGECISENTTASNGKWYAENQSSTGDIYITGSEFPCHPTCQECGGPGQDHCLSCISGLEPALLNQKNPQLFSCQCPDGSYFEESIPCSNCTDEQCEFCRGPGDTCEDCGYYGKVIKTPQGTACECVKGFTRHPISNQCVPINKNINPDCKNDQYSDESGNCQDCTGECWSCYGPEDCDQCIEFGKLVKYFDFVDQEWKGKCVPSEPNMYFDGMNFVENTVENCAKSLPDENTCIECEMNYMPDADPITACNCMYDTDFCKIPLDKLPDGKVCEFGTFKQGDVCAKCSPDCRTCSEDANKCTSCYKGFEILPSNPPEQNIYECSCVIDDPSNPQAIVQQRDAAGNVLSLECQKCGFQCESCESSKVCLQCSPPYKVDPETKKCVCDETIAYFLPLTNECRPDDVLPPQSGKFEDRDGSFKSCAKECKECVGPCNDQCIPSDKADPTTACADGKDFVIIGGQDKPYKQCGCPKGSFKASETECRKCHPLCVSCYGPGSNECDECQEGKMISFDGSCECPINHEFDEENKECVRVELPDPCPNGQYLDREEKQCMPCHEYCEECLGPDKEDCAFCPASLKLIWDSGNHDEPGSMGIKGYGMYVDKPGLKIKGIIGKDDDDMMDMCKMDGFNKKDFEDKGIDFEEAEDDYDFEGPDKEDYEDDDKEDDDKEDYDKEDYDKEDDDKEDDEDDEEERKENNKAKVQEQKDGFGLILGACGCAHDQFVTTTLGCQLCHFSCDGCTGPSNDDCIECADLYEMNADKQCVCIAGYVEKQIIENGIAKLVCQPQKQQVWNCEKLDQYQPAGTTAKEQCRSCHNSCQTCKGPLETDCLSCKPDLDLIYTASGRCECEEGEFLGPDGCERCHKDCKNCDGRLITDCIECQPGFDVVEGLCQCQQGLEAIWVKGEHDRMKKICVSYDCPAGKFFDESETCNGSCDAACSKCIGPKPSDCLECAEGFVEYWKDMEYNTKMCGCSMGTSRYDKDNQNVCKPCHYSCVDCSGPGADQCLKCPENRFKDQMRKEGKCECVPGFLDAKGQTNCIVAPSSKECEPYQFLDRNTGQCKDCHKTCASCIDSPDNCIICAKSAMRDEKKMEMMDTEMESAEFTCDDIFKRRFMPNLKDDDDYEEEDFGQDMCSAGIGKAKPSFNKTETGQCRCREGFWLDENECKMCEVSGCKNCDGDTAVCQQCFEDREEKEAADGVDCPCFSGFQENEKGHCVFDFDIAANGDCPAGTFKQDDKCNRCHGACLTCVSQNPLECTSCWASTGMVLLDTEKPSSCVCKPGTFWSHMDDKCTKCHPRCETCYGPTEDDCMSCKPDAYEEVKTCKGLSCKCAATYKINKYTQECVSESECASGTFISFKNECEPCHETCDTCDGPEEEDCLTCVGNLAETPEGACVCSSTDPYQFFDGTDCANCHESCKKCNGPEANDCLSCGPNSVLEVGKDSESGVCKCVANFEKNEDGECVIAFNVVTTCPVGCTHCLEYDYYSCLGCVDGARFTPDRLQDEMVLGYCECKSGTFFDTDKCTKCHETCKECSAAGADRCTKCPALRKLPPGEDEGVCDCLNGLVEIDGKCLGQDQCCPGQFLNEAGWCQDCHKTCETCTGPGKAHCTGCSEIGNRVPSTSDPKECVCKDGFFDDKGDCVECPPLCTKCLNRYQCTECTANALPKSTGSEDKADDKDELCECDIENGFLFVPSKGECIQPYDTGCDPSCEFCVGPSPNSCTECRANFGAAVIEKSPDSNFFSCQCPDGYFFNDSASNDIGPESAQPCDFCHLTCRTCTGPDKTDCLTCADFTGKDLPNLANSCDCPNGFRLFQKDGTPMPRCVPIEEDEDCGVFMFANEATGECEKCSRNCLDCHGTATACKMCDPVTQVLDKTNNLCNCVPGYFKTDTGECARCSRECEECQDSADYCTKCAEFTYKVPDSGVCKCPAGYAEDANGFCVEDKIDGCRIDQFGVGNKGNNGGPTKFCKQCDFSCRTCNGPNHNNCTSCWNPEVIELNLRGNSGHGECQCKPGYYQSGNLYDDCEKCDPRCKECTCGGSENCIECADGLERRCGKCSCPDNSIWSNLAQECVSNQVTTNAGKFKIKKGDKIELRDCPEGCSICLNEDVCLKCMPGVDQEIETYIGTTPVFECSRYEGTFLGETGYRPCHPTCSDCDGPTEYDCTECSDNTHLQPIDDEMGMCLCNKYFERNDAGECSPQPQYAACHNSCSTCIGPESFMCISCPDTMTFFPEKQQDEVVIGSCGCEEDEYYDESDSITPCKQCDLSCNGCRGEGSDNCKSCDSMYHPEENSAGVIECVCNWDLVDDECELPLIFTSQICTAGFFEAESQDGCKECQRCNPNCEACIGPNSIDCVLCDDDKVLTKVYEVDENKVGQCICRRGTFQAFDECHQCHFTCKECTGPTENDCKECKDDTAVFNNVGPDTGYCECNTGSVFNLKGLCQSSSDFECDARCYGCADSNNGRACYDCADSSFLKEPSDDIGLFSCKCRSGFFFDGSICDLCEDPCVECGESSTDCKVCDKAFKRVLENGTCECMEGFEDLGSGCVPTNYHNTGTACTNEEFWEESTESCKPCSLNCWSCEEKADSCLTCRYGFQQEGGQCKCQKGLQFDPASNKCIKCPEGCFKCHLNGSDVVCDVCESDYYLDVDQCEECGDNCLECTVSGCLQCEVGYQQGNVCNTCEHGFTDVLGECLIIPDYCQVGQYEDENGKCQDCDSSCVHCEFGGIEGCTVCPKDRQLVKAADSDTGICVCKPDFYEELFEGKEGELIVKCAPCHGTCNGCTGSEAHQCINCKTNTSPFPLKDGIICEPDDTFYFSEFSGELLDLSALTAGVVYDRRGDPHFCFQGCTKCVGPDPDECTGCASGFVPVDNGEKVFACRCEDGTYFDKFSQRCKQCDPQCETCTGRGDGRCIECGRNTYKIENATLSQTNSVFDNPPEKLSVCKCLDNYILSVDGCVPNPELEGCESGCTCAPGCLGCLDSHEESCLICDNSIAFLYLDIIDEENQTGLCTCPETTYWDGSACQDCGDYCLECTDNSTCTVCDEQAGFILNGSNSCQCQDNFDVSDLGDICVIDESLCDANCGCGALDLGSSICEPCNNNCAVCDDVGPDNQYCTICKDPNQVHDGSNGSSGNCRCISGFGLFNKPSDDGKMERQCIKCENFCDVCKQPPQGVTTPGPLYCETCQGDMQPNSVSGICECPPGTEQQWQDDKLTSNCLLIQHSCPQGEYQADINNNASCTTCHSNCLTCAGPDPDNCLTCKTDTIGTFPFSTRYDQLFSCECKNGFYPEMNADIIENCAPCPDLCGSCDSDTQCGEDCKENAVNSNPGNDVCDCRDGYAPVTPDGQPTYCEISGTVCNGSFDKIVDNDASCSDDCSEGCNTCNDAASICYSCFETFIPSGDECKCPDKYTVMPSTADSNEYCEPCNAVCNTCTAGNPDECETCNQDITFIDWEEKCVCLPDFVQDDGNCVRPPKKSNGCGYRQYLDAFGTCVGCQAYCRECTSGDQCTKLSANAIINAEGLPQCMEGYYWDQFYKQCIPCGPKCLECNATQCLKCTNQGPEQPDSSKNLCICAEGRNENEDGQCVFTNPLGGFCAMNEYPQNGCTACSDECASCNIDNTACLSCNDYYIFDESTGECSCDGYGPPDQQCQACDKRCLTCSGPTEMECLECSNPLDTDISDGCSCPKGYFYFDGVKDCIFKEPCQDRHYRDEKDNTCKFCDGLCSKCTNLNACTECMPNSLKQKGEDGSVMSVSPCECDESKGAYSSKITLQEQNEDLSGKTKEGRSICRIKDICLENEYLDTSLNIYKCTKCSSSCKTCNGAGDQKCTSCEQGEPVQGKCSCDESYFFNGVSCQQCNKGCKLCEGKADNCTSCKEGFTHPVDESGKATSTDCFCNLKAGYFISTSGACLKCNENCLTCKGQLSSQCESCNASQNLELVRIDSEKGVCNCKAGFTWDSVDKTCKDQSCPADNLAYYKEGETCIQCPSTFNCAACVGDTEFDCQSCIAGSFFIPQDDSVSRPVSGKCTCKSTTSSGDCDTTTACLEPGFYLKEKGKPCEPCQGSCKNCDPDCVGCANSCETCVPSCVRCDKDGCKECAKTSTGLENRRIVDGVCVCKDEYKDPTNSIVCLDQIILGGDNCPPGIPQNLCKDCTWTQSATGVWTTSQASCQNKACTYACENDITLNEECSNECDWLVPPNANTTKCFIRPILEMLILQFETPVTSATGGDLKLSDLIGSESVDTSVEKLTVVEMFGSNGQLKNQGSGIYQIIPGPGAKLTPDTKFTIPAGKLKNIDEGATETNDLMIIEIANRSQISESFGVSGPATISRCSKEAIFTFTYTDVIRNTINIQVSIAGAATTFNIAGNKITVTLPSVAADAASLSIEFTFSYNGKPGEVLQAVPRTITFSDDECPQLAATGPIAFTYKYTDEVILSVSLSVCSTAAVSNGDVSATAIDSAGADYPLNNSGAPECGLGKGGKQAVCTFQPNTFAQGQTYTVNIWVMPSSCAGDNFFSFKITIEEQKLELKISVDNTNGQGHQSQFRARATNKSLLLVPKGDIFTSSATSIESVTWQCFDYGSVNDSNTKDLLETKTIPKYEYDDSKYNKWTTDKINKLNNLPTTDCTINGSIQSSIDTFISTNADTQWYLDLIKDDTSDLFLSDRVLVFRLAATSTAGIQGQAYAIFKTTKSQTGTGTGTGTTAVSYECEIVFTGFKTTKNNVQTIDNSGKYPNKWDCKLSDSTVNPNNLKYKMTMQMGSDPAYKTVQKNWIQEKSSNYEEGVPYQVMCYVNPNEATEKECGAIYVINSSPSGILQITTETVDGETIITATFLNWIDEENDLPFTYRLECTNKDGSVIKFEQTTSIATHTLPTTTVATDYTCVGQVIDSEGSVGSSTGSTVVVKAATKDDVTKSVASGLTKAKESTKSEDKSSYVAVVSKSVKSNGKDSADTNTLNEIKGIVNDVINIISGDTSQATLTNTIEAIKDLIEFTDLTDTTQSLVQQIANNADDKLKDDDTCESILSLLAQAALNILTGGRLLQTTDTVDYLDSNIQLVAQGATSGLVAGTQSFFVTDGLTIRYTVEEDTFTDANATISAGFTKNSSTVNHNIEIPQCFMIATENQALSRTTSTNDELFGIASTRISQYLQATLVDQTTTQTLMTDSDCDSYITFKIPLQLPETTSINFPNCGEYNYESGSIGYNWSGTSCPAGANLDTEDSRYTKSDLGDTYVIFATQYDQDNQVFTTGSLNNRLMVVNWEDQTATIYSRSLGTFAVVIETKTSVDPNNFVIPTIDTSSDDDDFDVWEEFNATYFAALLLGLTLIYVAIAFVVDKKYKPKVQVVQDQSQPKQAFSQGEEQHNPEKGPTVLPDAEVPAEASRGFCRFFLEEHLLISPIINSKWNYSRPARVAVMMITLIVELFLIGYLLFLDEWIYATLVAAVIGLFITPILAIALYIPTSLSSTAKIVKTIIALVIGLAIVGVCLALIIVQTDDVDEEDNDNWVYAFLVLLPVELLVAESLKTTVKYFMIKALGNSCGGIINDF